MAFKQIYYDDIEKGQVYLFTAITRQASALIRVDTKYDDFMNCSYFGSDYGACVDAESIANGKVLVFETNLNEEDRFQLSLMGALYEPLEES